jgi:hypothetical protein
MTSMLDDDDDDVDDLIYLSSSAARLASIALFLLPFLETRRDRSNVSATYCRQGVLLRGVKGCLCVAD